MTDKTRELFEAWHIEEFGHKPDHLYAAEMYAAFAHQQAIIDRMEAKYAALHEAAWHYYANSTTKHKTARSELHDVLFSRTTTKEQGNG